MDGDSKYNSWNKPTSDLNDGGDDANRENDEDKYERILMRPLGKPNRVPNKDADEFSSSESCENQDDDDNDEDNPFIARSKAQSDIKKDSMLCGLFGWRPAWLQPLANVYVFSALVGLSYFFSGMAGKSLFSQLVSIERQFNIDSTKSGLFNSAWHFGFASSVLFAGHFAKSINIPLAIGIAGVINGLLVMAPSFLELYSPYELPQLDTSVDVTQKLHPKHHLSRSDHQFLCTARNTGMTWTPTDNNGSITMYNHSNNNNYSFSEIASHNHINNDGNDDDDDDNNDDPRDRYNVVAYYVLLISMLLQGVINAFRYGALPFIYVDNNVLDKTKTGVYLAISFIFAEFTGPVGDLVNGFLSKVPVDLSDTAMSPEDPRFVSAWWLGFLVFGALSVIAAIPIPLLPRHLVPEEQQQEALTRSKYGFAGRSSKNLNLRFPEPPKSSMTTLEMIKDFPKSVIRIFKNPMFALLAIEISVIVIPLAGIGPFYTKYIMFEYNVSMAETNMARGLTSALTHILGTAIGSAASTRIHTNMGYLRLILVTAFLGCMLTPLYIYLSCDNRPIAGLANHFGANFSYLHSNNSCICDPDRDLLSCGSDGITYLSPCFAGCTVSNGTVFSNCDQLQNGNYSSFLIPGICDVGCHTNFYLLNLLAAARTFIFSINNMPRHLLALRILNPEDRAVGSAFMHFAPFVVSSPSPIVFGKWIESMCVVWSSDHCSLYDRDSIRYLIGGVEMMVATLTVVTYAFMVILCRRHNQKLLHQLQESQEKNDEVEDEEGGKKRRKNVNHCDDDDAGDEEDVYEGVGEERRRFLDERSIPLDLIQETECTNQNQVR